MLTGTMGNLVFVSEKGKNKTQLQRDIEILKEYIDKKAEYCSHLGKFGNRNSFSKTDTVSLIKSF
ncbi:MAG: hypothetical protein IKK94_06880 [Clostridia bacterium]|nr:hypothetical protein [Clostridia bacterium]